jgi:hypothetical protein
MYFVELLEYNPEDATYADDSLRDLYLDEIGPGSLFTTNKVIDICRETLSRTGERSGRFCVPR